MVKTRRSARKAYTDTSSQVGDDSQPPSPTQSVPASLSIHLDLPHDIPLESLSTLIPDTSLDAPSAETILHIYKLLLAQAADLASATSDLEDARAQIVRKDVELDQALQDKESAVAELEQSVEAVRNELQTAAQQRDELNVSQSTLQYQLSTLSSSQSTRSSELDSLQRRVDETEREKRDLVVVVDRLRSDGVQAEEETRTLRESLKKARAEFSELQSEIREVRSTETSNKFKIQSLDQQLELTKQESERNSSELDAKIEEFGKYRREAHAQYVSLQSAFDSLTHAHESCKTEFESLKHTHQNQQHQLTTALDKINSLQDQLAEEGAASRAQSDTQTRLIELLEKRNAEAKKRVQDLDNEWDRTVQDHNEREERLKEQLRREKERADRLDTNLTRVIESSEGSTGPGFSNTPEPSSGASIVAGFMKGTRLSDIFDENRRVKEELQKVKLENIRLTDTTTQLISKVQEMAPQLGEQRVEYARQKSETIQLSKQLSVVLSERDTTLQHARDIEHKFVTSQKEKELLETQLKDLGRQVQALLREISIQQNSSFADVEQEDDPPSDSVQGIDALISNQLVVFKHLSSFQEQYTKHLKVIRDLGDKLEKVTSDQYEEQSRLETQALEEAEAAVVALQDELENQRRSHDIQIRGFVQERDMYKARLTNQGQSNSALGGISGHTESLAGDVEYESLLADLQRNFDVYRTEMGVDMTKLRDELQDAQRETAQLQAALGKANAKVEHHNGAADWRHAMLNDSYARQRDEVTNLRRRNEDLLNHVHRIETASHQVSEQLANTNSVVERLRHETATLRAEKELWKVRVVFVLETH
ncbi:hypothetical protein K439DRAFT_123735 [Ramaria rubella]|nr:hypothetical protein K439DRAFT_123735 [Ramaria rubella]